MERDSKIRILHLEDCPADSLLVQSWLRKANVDFEYFYADNEADYLNYLENQKIDIILSDYHLPDYSGSEALQVARTRYPLIPFVFVSGTMGEEAAIESLLNGATDYVLKSRMERVGAAIRFAVKESQEKRARLMAEQALFQSEENFHRSIAESPLGIRIVSLTGETVYVNRAFLDIYEFDSLEEFNSTPANLRYTQDSFMQHQERKLIRLNGGEIFDYELSIVRKNGEIRYVKVSRKEVIWNGTKHFQVINIDITDQKKLTLDLIAAKDRAEESDRLKTAFLHNISHEIRTPMNSIIGFSELLNDEELSGDLRKYYTNLIILSSNHLLSIITDIVNIATIEAGQAKIFEAPVNINAVLRVIYDQFLVKATNQKINLYLDLGAVDNTFEILADETKLIQIITNLIGNALKFTRQGYIRFGYQVIDDANLPVNYLKFFVEDTGIGIPKEMHREIFKRFRQVENTATRQFGGSGLGLSISKAYVELLGGKIWLESEVDKGSVFYFTLPLKLVENDLLTQEKSSNYSN